MLRRAVPVLGLLLAGCAGPIVANSAIFKAQSALQEADAAGAKEKALYQYTLGLGLLEKAWEEQAHSSYQSSRDLAIESERAFREATRQSTTRGAGDEGPLPSSEPEKQPASGGGNWGLDGD